MLTVKYLLLITSYIKLAAVRRRSGKTSAASTRFNSFDDLDQLAMDSYTGTSFHFYGFILFNLFYLVMVNV